VSAEQLAADLAAATANIDAWVQARAADVADARVVVVEEAAAARVAAYEQAFAVERRRHTGLEAELRKQLEAQLRWQASHVRNRCMPAET
jgi:hypothetical protein